MQVAEAAGRALDPNTKQPFDRWFDLLRESYQRLGAHHSAWNDPHSGHTIFTLARVAQLSARLCALQGSGALPSIEKRPLAPSIQTPQNNRSRIDAFILSVLEATSERITRTAIWRVAGYGDRTEFERFQREDPKTTRSANENFNRVLTMTPERFMDLWRKAQSK